MCSKEKQFCPRNQETIPVSHTDMRISMIMNETKSCSLPISHPEVFSKTDQFEKMKTYQTYQVLKMFFVSVVVSQ